jgi:putative endonuclease
MKKRVRRKFRRTGRFWVYIVTCSDGTFYTGFTPDLKKRIKTHNKGRGAKYTRDRRPVRLVWKKEYRRFKPAFKLEKIIKRLTRPEKKSLVKGRRLSRVLADAGLARKRPGRTRKKVET